MHWDCGASQSGSTSFKIEFYTGLDKQKFSAYHCKYFLACYFEHMFWVLKRTVSLSSSFEDPQHMFWLSNKKTIFLLHTLNLSPGFISQVYKRVYSKTCLKQPLKNRQNKGLNGKL